MLPMFKAISISICLWMLTLLLNHKSSTSVRAFDTSSADSTKACTTCHISRRTRKLENETVEAFTTRLFLHYHKLYRPRGSLNDTKSNTSPTRVKVNMHVATFSSVNVIEMDYSVEILLRQRWYDYRLMYQGYDEQLSLNYMKDRLWIPDLFFRNAKDGHLHTITTPNYLIWLEPDGKILFSQKLSVKLSCPMYLWKFPMDTQHCLLEIGSYGYDKRSLVFEWLSATEDSVNVELNKVMVLNEFDKPHFKTDECTKSYNSTGKFTCIYVKFILERKFGFYLIYTYLPSILIVIISWVSFFIDFQAVPARISLGLLSVLSLITQSAATLQKLPRVSYIKAIDVWLFACLFFVVSSLLEFAVVNVLTRRQEKKEFSNRMRNIIREELTQTVPWALASCILPGGSDVKKASANAATPSNNNNNTTFTNCPDTPGTAFTQLSSPQHPISSPQLPDMETLLHSTSLLDLVETSHTTPTATPYTTTTAARHHLHHQSSSALYDDHQYTHEEDKEELLDEGYEIWKRNGSYITNPGHANIMRPSVGILGSRKLYKSGSSGMSMSIPLRRLRLHNPSSRRRPRSYHETGMSASSRYHYSSSKSIENDEDWDEGASDFPRTPGRGGAPGGDRAGFRESSDARRGSNSKKKYLMKAKTVDRICVFAFPALFLLFNLIYWTYFLLIAKE